MNVHPSLPDHPKYLLFKEALGHPDALEFLARLWAHCQVKSRGENWGKVTDRYVELSCRWAGAPGRLFAALALSYEGKPGWVHRKKSGELIVSGWEEHNRSLLNTWRNGATGGRPKVSDDRPRVNPPKPGENPRVNPPKPTANPIGSDLIGSDCTEVPREREKGNAALGEARIQMERQWGACHTFNEQLKKKPRAEWTPEERESWQKNRATMKDIEKKQRAGVFA